jgi:hypothetical protein
VDPCGFIQCSDTTEVHFSSATNQCICQVRYLTPALIQQATHQVVEQNASVYAVQPYFLDGVISFEVQLSGAPGGFNLNASTIIAAASIGKNPQPNLVLVPKTMRSRVPKATEETAMIIAVNFNTDDSIVYYVQLSNGKIVKLYGDKFVHDIDLIEPNAPPALSFITSHMPHRKRDGWDQDEESTLAVQAGPMTITKRGMNGISSSSATFLEETCRSISCLGNGGQPAMFNPFLKSCYCKTLTPPKTSSNDKFERSKTDSANGPARREASFPYLPGSFKKPGSRRPAPAKPSRTATLEVLQPSVENCGRMIKCHGESQSYFEPNTKQCLCVVWRPGIKEPVITSDSKVWPREEQALSQQEDDEASPTQDSTYPLLGPVPTPNGLNISREYCAKVWAKANCSPSLIGKMNPSRTSCYCAIKKPPTVVWPWGAEDSVDTTHQRHDAPLLGKHDDCADKDLECGSDLMATRRQQDHHVGI